MGHVNASAFGRTRFPVKSQQQSGQATVEFALVLPLICLMLLVMVQVGVIVERQIMLVHATREAVRVGSVDSSSSHIENAAIKGASLSPSRLKTTIRRSNQVGGLVEVRLRYKVDTNVPVIGEMLPSITLTSAAAMRIETQ